MIKCKTAKLSVASLKYTPPKDAKALLKHVTINVVTF